MDTPSLTNLCLRNVEIYEGISEEEIMEIAKDSIEDYAPKGTIFYTPDQPAKHIFVLKQGEVELYHKEGGKKVLLETLFPGDVFGDLGAPTTHYAMATRRSLICQTPTQEYLDIIRHHPEMAFVLMRALAEKTSQYESKIASLARPAKQQVLDELRNLQRKQQKSLFGKMFAIKLRISHEKLAEKAGLNRVTVTKILGQLQQEGAIEIDPVTREIRVMEKPGSERSTVR